VAFKIERTGLEPESVCNNQSYLYWIQNENIANPPLNFKMFFVGSVIEEKYELTRPSFSNRSFQKDEELPESKETYVKFTKI